MNLEFLIVARLNFHIAKEKRFNMMEKLFGNCKGNILNDAKVTKPQKRDDVKLQRKQFQK